MSILKKLAGETALYGLSSIIGRLITFVFLTPYLTRRFPNPEQMGIQTDLYAWAAFLMVLFTYRMETAFFRYGSKEEQRGAAFGATSRVVTLITIVLLTLMVVLSQPLANLLEYPHNADYIICFAFILGFDALSAIPFAWLRLQGKAAQFAKLKLLNLGINLGSLLFFLEVCPRMANSNTLWAQHWYSHEVGIGFIFIANLLASTITFLLLMPAYWEATGTAGFDKEKLREMLRYAHPLVIVGFAGIINEVLDRVLLKWLSDGTLEERLIQVGIYGSCYKIAIFMNLFTQAFNYAAEPFFFKHAERNDARHVYADVTYLFTLAASLLFLGIMLFMHLGQYFVAESYREGLSIVPHLLLANLFLGIYYNVSIWYKLGNRTQMGAVVAIIGAGVTIVANIVLIPLLGYMGSAWATLLCYATMMVLCYLWGQRYFPVPYPIQRILGCIGLAIAVWLLHRLIAPTTANLFVQSLISAVFWLLFAGFIFMSERKTIRRILRRQ